MKASNCIRGSDPLIRDNGASSMSGAGDMPLALIDKETGIRTPKIDFVEFPVASRRGLLGSSLYRNFACTAQEMRCVARLGHLI
jgi:hypothetical protein